MELVKEKSKEMQEWDFLNSRQFEKDFNDALVRIKEIMLKEDVPDLSCKISEKYKKRNIITNFDFIANCLKDDYNKYKTDFVIVIDLLQLEYINGREETSNKQIKIGCELKENKTRPSAHNGKWAEEAHFEGNDKDTLIIDEKSIKDLLKGIEDGDFNKGFALVLDNQEKSVSYFSMIDLMFNPHQGINRNQDGKTRGKQLYNKIEKQTLHECNYKTRTAMLVKVIWDLIKYLLEEYEIDLRKTECHDITAVTHIEGHLGVVKE